MAGMQDPADQFDTQIEIVTPENIAFSYRVAGPFQRLPAYLLDVLFQALIFLTGTISLSAIFGLAALPGLGQGLVLVLLFIVSWFYAVLFEVPRNGRHRQTPAASARARPTGARSIRRRLCCGTSCGRSTASP